MTVFSLTTKAILLCLMLSGCSSIRVKVATDCSWAAPIEADDETADWLESLEWPKGFEDFMKDVGDHTELYYRWCE